MKKLLILLFALLFLGCASNSMMLIEGEPAVTTAQVFKHPKTGINTYTRLEIISEIPEGDEKLEIVEYIKPLNSEIFEIKEIKDFQIEINILNLNKVEYIVLRTMNIHYDSGGNGKYDQVLYKGNLSRKKVVDSLPLYPGARVFYRIFVADKEGHPMFKLSDVKYYMKGGKISAEEKFVSER